MHVFTRASYILEGPRLKLNALTVHFRLRAAVPVYFQYPM